MAPEIYFYNSLTRQKERFEPIEPGKVKLYVCGPTVYDEAHLGHARCYMTWDVLNRFLRFMGFEVTYVRNITDVDDKILNRAKQEGISPQAVAEKYTQRFHDVMAQLNVLSPTHEPRATAYLAQMHAMIETLIATDYAYPTSTGVYYNTQKKQNYGNLCHQSLDDLQSGARIDVDPEKKSPLDFALWKLTPESEGQGYPSPFGYGRPGWHIECSAMSHSVLGEQLDIHAGGMDLIFPHHQNEIAQSEAFTGVTPFVKTWMHNGFVNVSGEKMSKSLGNFSTIATLLETYDPNTLRYFLLSQHYRTPVNFNDEALQGAKNRVQKIQANITRLSQQGNIETQAASIVPKALIEALCDDLNTPNALRELDSLYNENQFTSFLLAAELLGFGFSPKESSQETEITAYVTSQIESRQLARVNKDWATSDRIRDELAAQGIILEDHKDGRTTWIYDASRATAPTP